jgi:sugar O-acyltransferase (sialic acid O-acetyltransferase NeuD family)
MKKIILLGHSDGGVPIIMDLGAKILGCLEYDIVKNVDRPDCPYPTNLYKAEHFFDFEYDFDSNRNFGVHFGVHHSNVKYLLYHHFLENYNINTERYLNLIHPSAYFAPSSKVKSGAFIEPMTLVSTMADLGFGVTIKASATVSHHALLGDFVNINPGAVIAGYVKIGEATEIGAGAVISNNITIGKRCLIGAGSVVTRDIPDGVIAYGNPCKVVRENERWNSIKIRE